MKLGSRIVLPLVMGFLFAGQALASGSTVELETAVVQAPKERIWTIGLGAAAVPDYEGSEDYKAAPVPLLKVIDPDGWYVDLIGNTLRANVLSSHTWRLGPLLRYRAERDDVHNNAVDKMKKVDATIEGGAFVGFDIQNWNFKVEAATDLGDEHEGSLLSFSGGYTWPMENWRMSVNAFTTLASGDYMSTYFGVDKGDAARSGLPTFDADGGFKDVGGTLVVSYRFTPHWGLIGAARYTRLLGDAADSPLVEDEGSEDQGLLGLVLSYTF